MIVFIYLFAAIACLDFDQVALIQNFDQFVRLYGKLYKNDEYADRRENFATNTRRMQSAQKLTGIPMEYSFYSDYSEVRFRKMLMTNNEYPEPILSEIKVNVPNQIVYNLSQSWNDYIPYTVNVDPSIKCASSWAVAVTSLIYMKFKEYDPLWNDAFSIQQLLDCVNDKKALTPESCDGASIESALRYVYEKGICLEKDYRPFSGTREKCSRSTCNRYFISSYKRIYPSFPSLLNEVSKSPVISTIGVNPDVLQFYVSQNGEEKNFMSGVYHHQYSSGIITEYDLTTDVPFIALVLPAVHPLSKKIYFRIGEDCIRDTLNSDTKCNSDIKALSNYVYSITVKPLPSIFHTFSYFLIEESSLLSAWKRFHWINPWNFILYEKIIIWGINVEEFIYFLDSVQNSIPSTTMNICNIKQLTIVGLYHEECPFFDRTDSEHFDSVNGICQMNETAIIRVLTLISNCPSIESIEFTDHSILSETIVMVLNFFLKNIDKFPMLKHIDLTGNFVTPLFSGFIENICHKLYEKKVIVEGIIFYHRNEIAAETYFKDILNNKPVSVVEFNGTIDIGVYELFLKLSPFRFANKIILKNTCSKTPAECAHVAYFLMHVFESFPHYYLRTLELDCITIVFNFYKDNGMSTKDVLLILLSIKNYPRLSSISFAGNYIEDSFFKPFKVFIQDSTVFPSLRRINLANNQLSANGCQQIKDIFMTQYDRSTVVSC